jgi:hypothetical protein
MINFERWGQGNYMGTFFVLFLILGFLFMSQAFPAFRNNTKCQAFLMLPATNSEKYVFELLSRIVGYIIIMPIIFWIVANIEGTIVHYYVPELVNYKFSFIDNFSKSLEITKTGFWGVFGTGQAILFVFIAAITGASHFSRSPLVKTLFTFSTIVSGYFLFSYLLYRGLNLREYHPTDTSMFISKDKILLMFALAGTVINITLLAVAWFRLKEREA